jgi:phage tail sheath protein FI
VWKAPAGVGAQILGITDLAAHVDDAESGVLNPLAVNALCTKPLVGPVVWGARTTVGANELGDQWKYLPVRRTALYIEESLRRATQWVVFEPNDEPLWARVRQSITNFLTTTWRSGALQGSRPDEAFFVRCDRSTMTQDDIDNGRLICLIGIAPVFPAEFVIFRIQQKVDQTAP